MSRQITAKSLSLKRRRPFNVTNSGIPKVPCPQCKRRNGRRTAALRNAQNLKNLRNQLSKAGLLAESAESGVVKDAHHILSAMGIGCVTDVPVQPNPRSPDQSKVKVRSDFSLLKIETDKTVIPNANIFDKKSMRLKRGETKFVKASDIIPFTQQSSFYKPPDPPTPREQRRALKERNRAEKPNVAAIVYQIFVHQQRLQTKLMDPNFKIAMKKVGV